MRSEILMMLALMQQKQYEKTNDTKQFNDAAATIRAMFELNRDDPRGKQILQGLIATWRQRNPDAKPEAPKK